jgi:hypothetical protein
MIIIISFSSGSTSLTSTLTTSFMDVQNANEAVGVTRAPNTTGSNQTLLIHHHSQTHQHFATAVATAHPPVHHNSHQSQNQQQQHQHHNSQSQQHTVHHPPTSTGSSSSQGHVGSSPGDGSHHQEMLTLEMSHEDIQQTLSANMGMGDSGGELEPMSPGITGSNGKIVKAKVGQGRIANLFCFSG